MLAINGGSPVRTREWAPDYISTEQIGLEEKERVLHVLEKRRLFRWESDQIKDSETAQLEEFYSRNLNVKHALAVNSGSSALVTALVALGIGPGDEVIVPSYTFIATASAVLIAGAVPVIVNVDDTLTLCPKSVENAITKYTKAVIPVHMRGIPSQMDIIISIANRYNLKVIEDVAQANGGSFFGEKLGSIGDVGCFSFQQSKLITSGEGGMLVTNDDHVYERACTYHDGGLGFRKTSASLSKISFPAANFRMSELNAAIGLAQSERINELIVTLQGIKTRIIDGIRDLDFITMHRVPDPKGEISTNLIFYANNSSLALKFSNCLLHEGIPNGVLRNRGFADQHIYTNWDYIIKKRGISSVWNPWSKETYKGNVEYSLDMCKETLSFLSRAITIPLHPSLSEADCNDAIEAIRKVAASFN
ncbi:8-amino-3,8-dideoxy-alpha-D-manno-octulosonate transaminase [Paenibacillus sp. JGP012]|uniref:DegT/DnrJ/EryC1/StrS family aminotransferase n=1 Tax=Paenibacillus sp. JGP012 TaxID=2735914 RepID=UPI00161D1D0F|nr:DegT/DnrJ/EryC1/StrS family aminotransferase [Paenibacillus sp. JGP012]MBB6022759.1 8-amino-3,8-dideoxy-alpha-D-manno-octulosonate transaminase [Paenibacillus sp. JGP012]